MKHTRKIINEIDSTLKVVDRFMLVLKTLVILVVSYLVLAILGVDSFLAIVPALVYLVSSLLLEPKIDNVKRLERKYKTLDEKIITARDYQNEDNIVLEALEEDIVDNMKQVHASSFLPLQSGMILILVLILSVGGLLYVVSEDIRVIDLDAMVDEMRQRFEEEEEVEEADFTGTEASIMSVGGERLEVEINPVGMDIDFNQVTDDAYYEFSTSFPREAIISSGTLYEQEFSEEQQLLIKKYFENKNR